MVGQDERAKILNEMISVGDEVKELIASPTWQKYIEPLFDAMIGDVLGRKLDGRWLDGELTDKELSETKLRELQAYKQGMIKVHQEIHGLVDAANVAREEILSAQNLSKQIEDYNYYNSEE